MLVTGGAGFVGSHLVDLLLEAGSDEVIILDDLVEGRVATLAEAMESGRIHLVVADVQSATLLADLLQGVDTVFHQVPLRHAAETRTAAAFDLLDRCLRAGVRKMVISYPAGYVPGSIAQEFDECLPRFARVMQGMPCLLLRHADIYGPRMDVQDGDAGLLIRWMDRLAAGLPPLLPCDCWQSINLVHAEDLARANLLAALSPAAGLVLDICAGETITPPHLGRLLARIMGRRDVQPAIRPEPYAAPAQRRCAGPMAARERIGFTPAISLEAGLEALVTWWCNERDRVALQDAAP